MAASIAARRARSARPAFLGGGRIFPPSIAIPVNGWPVVAADWRKGAEATTRINRLLLACLSRASFHGRLIRKRTRYIEVNPQATRPPKRRSFSCGTHHKRCSPLPDGVDKMDELPFYRAESTEVMFSLAELLAVVGIQSIVHHPWKPDSAYAGLVSETGLRPRRVRSWYECIRIHSNAR